MFSRMPAFGEGLLRAFGVNGCYHTEQVENVEVTDDPTVIVLDIDNRGKPCVCAYVYNRGGGAPSDVFAEISVQVAGGRWFEIHTSVAIPGGTYWKLPHDHQRNVTQRVQMRLYVAAQADPQAVDAVLSAGLF